MPGWIIATAPAIDWEAVTRHGFGTVAAALILVAFIGWCGVIGYCAARAARWFANKVVIPLRDGHLGFLQNTSANLTQQTQLLGTLADKQEVQVRQLVELKQVIEQNGCQLRHGCQNYNPHDNGSGTQPAHCDRPRE